MGQERAGRGGGFQSRPKEKIEIFGSGDNWNGYVNDKVEGMTKYHQ